MNWVKISPRYALLITGESIYGARYAFISAMELARTMPEFGGNDIDFEHALGLDPGKTFESKDKRFRIVRVR